MITKIGDNPFLPRLTLIIITFHLLSRISYAITQHAKKNCCLKYIYKRTLQSRFSARDAN